MGQYRTNIAGLMLLTIFFAIVIAALRDVSMSAASLVYSLAFGLNLVAVVATISCPGRTRSTSAGYAVFAWGYFIHAYTSVFPSFQNPPLFTSFLVTWVVGMMPNRFSIYDQDFLKLVHALLTIGSGLVGGGLAWGLTRRTSDLARPSNPTVDQP